MAAKTSWHRYVAILRHSLRLQHSSSRDDSNYLAMLPELTKLKITAVHCKHLSTHLSSSRIGKRPLQPIESQGFGSLISNQWWAYFKLKFLVNRISVLYVSPILLLGVYLPSNWRRPRGRPRQTWQRTISDDLKHLSLSSSARPSFVAEDRGNSYAHAVCTPPDDDDVTLCIHRVTHTPV